MAARKTKEDKTDETAVPVDLPAPENPLPVVATLDLPPEDLNAAIARALPEGAVVLKVPDPIEEDTVKIPAETWAASSLPAHHTGGFLAWARGQQIQNATVKEWRQHHDMYRSARVR